MGESTLDCPGGPCVIISERGRQGSEREDVIIADSEDGKGPTATEGSNFWKLEEARKLILPWSLQKGPALRTSALQNGEMINLCCFEPLSFGTFVTAATGNQHNSYFMPGMVLGTAGMVNRIIKFSELRIYRSAKVTFHEGNKTVILWGLF